MLLVRYTRTHLLDHVLLNVCGHGIAEKLQFIWIFQIQSCVSLLICISNQSHSWCLGCSPTYTTFLFLCQLFNLFINVFYISHTDKDHSWTLDRFISDMFTALQGHLEYTLNYWNEKLLTKASKVFLFLF